MRKLGASHLFQPFEAPTIDGEALDGAHLRQAGRQSGPSKPILAPKAHKCTPMANVTCGPTVLLGPVCPQDARASVTIVTVLCVIYRNGDTSTY
jgi:hypothetical protein